MDEPITNAPIPESINSGELPTSQPQTPIQPTVVQESPIAPPIPAQPEISKSKKSWILIAVFVLLILTAGFFAYQYFKSSATVPTPSPVVTSQPTPFTDTVDWQEYKNDFYNFSFKYPKSYELDVNETGGGFEIILNLGQENEIAIGISPSSIGNLKYFLDVPTTDEVSINGNTWYTVYLPKGYPDAGDQNPKPLYALKTTDGKNIYTVRVFNAAKITPELEQMLSTFNFQDSSSGLSKELFSITNNGEMGKGNKYSLEFLRPSNWLVQKITTNHANDQLKTGCIDYILENRSSKTSMSISPICSGYQGTVYPLPEKYEVVQKTDDIGNDSHTAHIIRYFSEEGNLYTYALVTTDPGKSISAGDKMYPEILVSYAQDDWYFIPFKIKISANSGTTISESDVVASDTLVKSMVLKRIN